MPRKNSPRIGAGSCAFPMPESKDTRYRLRTIRTWAVSLVVAASVTSQVAVAAKPVSQLAPACLQGAARTSACELISGFFAAVNAGRPREACALLGHELRLQTGGVHCPTYVALAGETPFQIVGAHAARSGVVVLVKVGVHEFDHVRMLAWAAYVGREGGSLRILDTRRV